MTQELDDLFDARFEFDAPRYYDFETASTGSPADNWFETASEGPGCKPQKPVSGREPLKQLQDNVNHGVEQPTATGDAGQQGEKPQQQRTINIVTSWLPGAGQNASKSVAPGTRPPVSKGTAACSDQAGHDTATAKGAAKAASGREVHPSCSSKKEAQHVGRVEPPVTRSMSVRMGLGLCSPVPESKPKYGSPPLTRSKAAVKRFYTVQKSKSSVAHSRRPATAHKVQQVLAHRVVKPARSTKPLTLPDDIELQTTKRCDGRPAQLDKSPFKPLAERVRDFQYKTPPRFKSKATKPASNGKRSPITKAEAPRLLTSTRNRPRSCKSQQELEDEQMREQFKARPVNTRVLGSSGQLGVPKVDKPQTTEPKPFKLRSDSRARVRRSHEHPTLQQAAAGPFKAQPVNRSILDGATFKPQREKQGLTKPVSPLLLTKRRAQTDASSAETEHPRSRPRTQGRAEPQHGSHGPSATAIKSRLPQPFRLQTELRGALHEQELAAKLEADAARAKRLRRVTARPLPVSIDVPVVPAKPEPRPLTLPDPFSLKSLDRHEEYEQQHRTRLQQQEEAARRAAEFKARPILTVGPFVVHESDAPLTVPEELALATDTRAVERAEFDAHMAAKIQQEEEERRQQEELKRKEEEEAVRRYRKKLRFSARPMPSFGQPFFAMPSEKALTKPKTPNFASKRLKKSG